MIPYAKLSVHKLKKIIKYFCVDVDATKASKLLGYNRKTTNRYYGIFRKIIYLDRIDAFKEKIGGEIEVDESYFGAKRKRGFA